MATVGIIAQQGPPPPLRDRARRQNKNKAHLLRHNVGCRDRAASIGSAPSSSSSTHRDNNNASLSCGDGMVRTYDVLANRLIERYEREAMASQSPEGGLRNDQLFVCVAGGPGSGKSTLSEAVARRINDRMMMGMEFQGDNELSPPACVVLPMDGFHYSRAQLRAMAEDSSPGGGVEQRRTYDDLLARRGAPWTFDAEGCIDAFACARLDGEASLPIYDRAKSDPVPGGVQLLSGTKIVLLEGNYLLSWNDPRWMPLRTLGVFDETWYVACRSIDEQRMRLVRRHLETWSEEKTALFGYDGVVGAAAKADSNDIPNLEWIDGMSRDHADLLIESV